LIIRIKNQKYKKNTKKLEFFVKFEKFIKEPRVRVLLIKTHWFINHLAAGTFSSNLN
jgi:hypothetical protein